jgi:DNA topoisomerase IB
MQEFDKIRIITILSQEQTVDITTALDRQPHVKDWLITLAENTSSEESWRRLGECHLIEDPAEQERRLFELADLAARQLAFRDPDMDRRRERVAAYSAVVRRVHTTLQQLLSSVPGETAAAKPGRKASRAAKDPNGARNAGDTGGREPAEPGKGKGRVRSAAEPPA